MTESYVTKIEAATGTLTITGTSELISKENIKLIIQKRKSTLVHQFPVHFIEENKWKVRINLNENEYENGVWDYYLRSEKERMRLKVIDERVLEDTGKVIYRSTDISREMECYITVKGSFSTKSKIASISLADIKGFVSTEGIVTIEGSVQSDMISKHDNLIDKMIVLKQRNSLNYYENNLKICQDSNRTDVYSLQLKLKYDDFIPSEVMDPIQWDAYIQLHLEGIDHLFRIEVETNKLEYQTRIHINKNPIYQSYFYSTINNYLSIRLTELKIHRDLASYTFTEGNLKLVGHAYFDSIDFKTEETLNRSIIIRNRISEEELIVPIRSLEIQELKTEFHDYRYAGFDVSISLKDIYTKNDNLKEVYDLYIQLEYNNEKKERKLGCEAYTYYVDESIDKDTVHYKNRIKKNYLHLTPYGNLRLESHFLSRRKEKYLKVGQHKDRLKKSKEDVWLIGERPDTAQDTGFHFFKYCRENYPKKKIYYVIKKDSKDLENIKYLGNVIAYGSMKHFKITAIATKFIGSHDLEYILPTRESDWPSYQEGKRVFLQHGVLGRKKVHYYKQNYKYPFTTFCVSSKKEFELVTREMGYKSEEVKITGLSRFDKLLSSCVMDNSIIIMPTWRDWIKNEQDFIESHYYLNYKELLSDEKLNRLLEKNKVKLKFYIHYRMQHYTNNFHKLENEYIKMVQLGNTDVQELLRSNKLLITDYSSVSFDFNYMGKPVMFYHFDFDSFFNNGILRPKEETFIGDICTNKEQLVKLIDTYINNEFEEKKEFKHKHHLNFTYMDRKNCERIFEAIINQ